ncbi:MAG: efflux transporter outer membrane subunit [Phycisphaerales bacterium]|nr:efflux transporter outer membrane subunit [Phycisphaerales bacterium]
MTRPTRPQPPQRFALPARCALPASIAAAAFALAGCMVGPDYRRPEAPLNDEWLGGPSAQDGAPERFERWWETFDDPALNALVMEAYRSNLTLRAAGLRVIEARARRQIAVGRFFPQVQQAVGDVGSVRLSENSAAGQSLSQADRTFSEASLGLEAAWELDFWGKFRRGIEASDALLLASVAEYDAALTILVADVAATYIIIRSLQERLAITETNVALQRRSLELTESRFRAGTVSELDVSSATTTLTSTQALVPELENALRQAKLALCVLLGRPPSTLDAELATADGAAARVPVAPVEIAVGIPADLLRRRPDVRAAERVAAARSAAIGVATADLFPQVSIVGATGFATSDFSGVRSPDLGDIFDSESFTGFVGLRINWPILQYGRVQGSIRAQDALFEQAAAEYQNTVLRAAADVESGLSEFLRSREIESFLGRSVAASQRTADLSLMQYRAGLVDFIRVNDALTRLVVLEDNLVEARARIALGAVRTYRALGGGWEIRNGREFIDAETAERMRARVNWGDVLVPQWHEGSDLFFTRPRIEEPEPEAPSADEP